MALTIDRIAFNQFQKRVGLRSWYHWAQWAGVVSDSKQESLLIEAIQCTAKELVLSWFHEAMSAHEAFSLIHSVNSHAASHAHFEVLLRASQNSPALSSLMLIQQLFLHGLFSETLSYLDFLESLEQKRAKALLGNWEWVLLECQHFRAAILSLRGDYAAAENLGRKIVQDLRLMPGLEAESFCDYQDACNNIESATRKMNQGHIHESERILQAVLSTPEFLDGASYIRATGTLIFCFCHLGRIQEAKLLLESYDTAVRFMPGNDYFLRSINLRMALETTEYRYEKALQSFRKAIGKSGKSSKSYLLVWHYWIMYLAEDGRIAEARAEISQAFDRARIAGLKHSLLNLFELDLFVQLRSGKIEDSSLKQLKDSILAEGQEPDTRDERSLLRCEFYHAAKKFFAAAPFAVVAADFELVIKRGLELGLHYDIFEAYLFLAATFFANGKQERAAQVLRNCLAKAELFENVFIAALSSYLLVFLFSEKASLERLAVLFTIKKYQGKTIPEFSSRSVDFFVQLFLFHGARRLQFTPAAGRFAVSEQELRSDLLFGKKVVLLQPQNYLFSRASGAKAGLMQFSPSLATDQLLAELLLAFYMTQGLDAPEKRGLTLQEVHNIRTGSKYTFDTDRHAAAAKALLFRLKNVLKPHHLAILYERESKCYYLARSSDSTADLLILKTKWQGRGNTRPGQGDVPRKRRARIDRAHEILSLLSANGTMTTAALCAALGVSRQALNQVMRTLLANAEPNSLGLDVFVVKLGCGPSTCYKIVNK